MHVLITGGAGFIGVHSARTLLSRGHRVTIADDLSHGSRAAVPEGVPLHVADVRSPAFAALVAQLAPDAILHLAARIDVRLSIPDPLFHASLNVPRPLNPPPP